MYFCFFVFKQKTAYEVRISDWSSDVCSSDLARTALLQPSTSSRISASARVSSVVAVAAVVMMFLSRWSRRSRPLHRPNAVLTQALISTLLAHVKVTRITNDFRAEMSAPPGADRYTVERGRAGRDRRPCRKRTCSKG